MWNKTPCVFLRQDFRLVQNQEQTQEVRLPEGLPDIGKVICSWGQVALRSKEWRSDAVSITGGVNAWVLYQPEDGSQCQSLAAWLPFQAKFDLPDSRREGKIRTCCHIRSLDARQLSSRKLMLRCTVSVLAEATEEAEAAIFSPSEEMPNVQLLQNTYPMTLPKEAGEKLFLMEEEVSMPQGGSKLMAWDLEPILNEQVVLGDKAVMKGFGRLHLVYMEENGKLHATHMELPFAQYAELDREYDKEATMDTMLAVSDLEVEEGPEQLHVKAGLIAQYVILDRDYLTVTEDAYSPFQAVELSLEPLSLPAVLDDRTQSWDVQHSAEGGFNEIVDAVFYPDHPLQYREGTEMILELPGIFQVLGYDGEGKLQTLTENVSARCAIAAGEGCSLCLDLSQSRPATAIPSGAQLQLSGQLQMQVLTMSQQKIPMVMDLELGEQVVPDPERPSLILRRMEEKSLWQMAKDCGSTVEAIRSANQLSVDPMPGQMLLIPVC